MTQLSEFSAPIREWRPGLRVGLVLGKSNSEPRAPGWELPRFAGAPVCEYLLYLHNQKHFVAC